MKEILQQTAEMVEVNRKLLKKSMFWEISSNSYAIMGGMLCTAKGENADVAKYKACKKIINKNVSIFSEIRGISKAVVASKMMLNEEPEKYLTGVMAVYKKLRSLHKLTASPFMVMAAMNIYEHAGVEGADADIEKLEELYKGLKKQHPLLISDSDRGYLSMLICSGINIQDTVEEIEKTYEACKGISIMSNTVHTLSQVLALSASPADEKSEFVQTMVKGLKQAGIPISKQYGLAAIGALETLHMPASTLIEDIVEVDNYLKTSRGFRWYNTGRRLRRSYAALIVFMSYALDKRSDVAKSISENIVITIVEEIIMMIVIMMLCSSVSSSSGSSSN